MLECNCAADRQNQDALDVPNRNAGNRLVAQATSDWSAWNRWARHENTAPLVLASRRRRSHTPDSREVPAWLESQNTPPLRGKRISRIGSRAIQRRGTVGS